MLGVKRGVEIGVYEGRFSKLLLLRCATLEKLYSIDPWLDANGKFDSEICNKATDRLDQFGPRSHIHIGKSPEAAELFDDGEMDFVFIDGDHSYEATLADIEAWVPKVRPGGIICGHDYSDRGNAICRGYITEEGQQRRKRVKRAVRTYINNSEKEYTLNLIAEHSIVWWFFV
jgi:predicted O-methyltransferase YrrM